MGPRGTMQEWVESGTVKGTADYITKEVCPAFVCSAFSHVRGALPTVILTGSEILQGSPARGRVGGSAALVQVVHV